MSHEPAAVPAAPADGGRRLGLIVGAAGSGKTASVLGELVRRSLARRGWQALDAPLLLLLAPEQQALSLEHRLHAQVAATARATEAATALARTKVLSFSRLAQQLALAAGRPLGTRLSGAAQRAVLWQIVQGARRNGAQVEALHSLFSELAQNGAGPTDLELLCEALEGRAAAPELSSRLAADLAQYSLDYAAYLELCREKGIEVVAPAARIPELLAATDYLAGAELWLDGFSGFTGSEWRALSALLDDSIASLNATLLLDAGGGEQAWPDPYFPTRRTATQLAALAARHGWRVERTPAQGTCPRPALHRAEVRTAECSDPRAEVEWAVREIVRLTRPAEHGGNGLRFGQISVVVPRLADYSALLSSRLADYAIRGFIDQRRMLAQHPLARYLRNALRLALEPHLPGCCDNADVLNLLSTGLLPLPAGEMPAALHELQRFARQQDWDTADWLADSPLAAPTLPPGLRAIRRAEGGADDAVLERLTRLRDTALRPVRTLSGWIARRRSVLAASDLIAAAWDTLQPSAEVEPEVAQALAAMLDELLLALEHCPLHLGAVPSAEAGLSGGVLLRLLDHALAELTLAQPPATQDDLLVTDIVRGRHGAVEATFLLGMNADSWPAPVGAGGIFTTQERNALLEAWERSAGAAQPQILHEPDFDRCAARDYLAEVALTRPASYLYAARPLTGPDKADLAPAPEFMTLVAASGQEPAKFDFAALAEWGNARSSDDLQFCGVLAASAPARDLPPHPQVEWARAQAARGNRWPPLPGLAAATSRSWLAQRSLIVSPTQLETFAACPFKHFARYALQLEPDAEQSFGRQQVGSIYHLCLEAVGQALIARGTGGTPDRLMLRGLVEDALAALRPLLSDLVGSQRAGYVLDRAGLLLGVRQDWASPQGAPAPGVPVRWIARVETGLGGAGGLPGLRLGLADGATAEVRGRIDRLDVDGDGRAWIVDYKLSGGSFKWARLASGLDLQLLLYLRALQAGEVQLPGVNSTRLQPQGACLQPLEPRRCGEAFEAAARTVPQPQGPLARETRERLAAGGLRDWALAAAEQLARDLAELIVDGEISPWPLRLGDWTACGQCSFRAVCRFDPLAGHRFRDGTGLDIRAVQASLAAGGSPELPRLRRAAPEAGESS